MAQRRHRAQHAGIAEERIEPAPALEDRGAEPVERVEILEVQRHQRGLAARLADFVVGFLEPAHGARHQDHMRAGRRQRDGRRASDAARGPGHEGDFILQKLAHRGLRTIPVMARKCGPPSWTLRGF